jgi:hypothetical protein
MKFLFISLFISLVNSDIIIKNKNVPVCRNCIYYEANKNTHFTNTLSKCKKFAEKELETDEIIFDYADFCRMDENKCGKLGKYYEKENKLEQKILIHYLIHYIPQSILISLWVFTMFDFLVILHVLN